MRAVELGVIMPKFNHLSINIAGRNGGQILKNLVDELVGG